MFKIQCRIQGFNLGVEHACQIKSDLTLCTNTGRPSEFMFDLQQVQIAAQCQLPGWGRCVFQDGFSITPAQCAVDRIGIVQAQFQVAGNINRVCVHHQLVDLQATTDQRRIQRQGIKLELLAVHSQRRSIKAGIAESEVDRQWQHRIQQIVEYQRRRRYIGWRCTGPVQLQSGYTQRLQMEFAIKNGHRIPAAVQLFYMNMVITATPAYTVEAHALQEGAIGADITEFL